MQQLDFFGAAQDVDPRAVAVRFLQETQGIGTPTISSVSGGRTSAWMAINYPTDYYVFALVRTNDPGHVPKDRGLVRAIQSKCPDFVGSLELPDTLRCVLELEQKIGKKIHWVWSSHTFESLSQGAKRGYLPNRFTRYCTQYLKYVPVFDWVQTLFSGIVEMNIGFRSDEPLRVYRMIGGRQIKGGWDWSELGRCEDHPINRKKYEWRFRQAPLFVDGVCKHHIYSDPWIVAQPFPEIPNCSHCFFKTPMEHVRQNQLNP